MKLKDKRTLNLTISSSSLSSFLLTKVFFLHFPTSGNESDPEEKSQ